MPVRPRLSVHRGFSKGKPLWFYSPTASKTHIIKPLNCYILCHIVSRLVCVFFRLSFYQFRHHWLQSNCYVKKPNSKSKYQFRKYSGSHVIRINYRKIEPTYIKSLTHSIKYGTPTIAINKYSSTTFTGNGYLE